jgi:MFS family permease
MFQFLCKIFSRQKILVPKTVVEQKKAMNSKAIKIQILMCTLANLTGMTAGMGLGFPASTTSLLLEDTITVLNDSQVSWVASITTIVCPIGGIFSAYLCDKFGRKCTLIVADIISIVSWAIIGFSSRSDSTLLFYELMIARVLIGLVCGMCTTPQALYSTEICHSNIRGRMNMLSSPFYTAFGMLAIYTLGYIIQVFFVSVIPKTLLYFRMILFI